MPEGRLKRTREAYVRQPQESMPMAFPVVYVGTPSGGWTATVPTRIEREVGGRVYVCKEP